MTTKLAEAKISGEVLSKLKEIVRLISELGDDLPDQAKVAAGLLANIMKGSTGLLSLSDAKKLAESLQDLESRLKLIDDAVQPKIGTVKELRTAIVELMRAMTEFLKKGGADESSSSLPGAVRASKMIRNTAILKEAVEGSEGGEWVVQLIKAGMSENRHMYPHEVLAQALPLFEGVKAYVDHPKQGDKERSVRDIAGWFEEVKKDDEGIVGKFVVSESQPWLKALLLDAYQKQKEDLCGFSIFAEGKTKLQRDGGSPYWLVESLDAVKSVDVVAEPAAGGRIKKLAESERLEVEELETLEKMSVEELRSVRPDLVDSIKALALKEANEKLYCPKCEWTGAADEAKDGKCPKCGEKLTSYKKPPEEEPTKESEIIKALESLEEKGEIPPGLAAYMAKKKKKKAGDEDEDEDEEKKKEKGKVKEVIDEAKRLTDSLTLRESRSIVREALSESDLPKVIKDKIQASFEGKAATEDAIQKIIKEEKETLGKLITDEDSPFRSNVRELTGEKDKIAKAFEGMISGGTIDGIKPFRSLKEAYATMKNVSISDIDPVNILAESRGYASSIRLVESIETGTFAELLGDSITRRLLKLYRLPALDDWKQVVSEINPLTDFRTQRRVRMGGYGILPSVLEGGTYQALTSPTDEEETYTPAKYGGLEDLTIETIANDDLGGVRRIPERLARAAKVTLYRFVFTLITANPTMGDLNSLFDAVNHGNLGSTALSSAELTVVKRAMRDQTAYGSTTEFLQITPKFILVPNELEATAQLLATAERNPDGATIYSGATAGPTTAISNQPNIHRNSITPIVVDFWTDADNWYVVADPQLMSTIEIGFLGGKQEPELFTQDEPTVGSVFTADKISYKIRHIYGGAVLDWRAFYAEVV